MLVCEATSFAYKIITLSQHGSFPIVVVGIIVIAKEQVQVKRSKVKRVLKVSLQILTLCFIQITVKKKVLKRFLSPH